MTLPFFVSLRASALSLVPVPKNRAEYLPRIFSHHLDTICRDRNRAGTLLSKYLEIIKRGERQTHKRNGWISCGSVGRGYVRKEPSSESKPKPILLPACLREAEIYSQGPKFRTVQMCANLKAEKYSGFSKFRDLYTEFSQPSALCVKRNVQYSKEELPCVRFCLATPSFCIISVNILSGPYFLHTFFKFQTPAYFAVSQVLFFLLFLFFPPL